MDVNQEFGKHFREVGVAEFFRKNLQMLGYSGAIRSFTTVIHEFVTNGLDACEEYGILPEITVKIKDIGEKKKSLQIRKLDNLRNKLEKAENEGNVKKIRKIESEINKLEKELGAAVGHYIVSVEDNGPGVPAEYIPKVFGSMLAGTKFHRYVQSRGQQGIGAVGAVLFSQMTTGKPTKIISSTGSGKTSIVFLRVDVARNRAKVVEESEVSAEERGTQIVSEFKGLLYRRGDQSPFEYLRRTALANPHATISFHEPTGKKIKWRRTSKNVPPLAKEMKPHPLGLSADDLMGFAKRSSAKKLSKFLQMELSRVSLKKAQEIIRISKVEDKAPSEINHPEAERIVVAFKQVKLLSPPTEGLTPIGEDLLEKSLEKILEAKFIKAKTRKPSVFRGGIPFQIEVAVAYGGKAGRRTEDGNKLEMMRFANKSPLLFDAGACAISRAVKSINWKNYNISDVESAPLTVFVNLISPHVPYQSAGKQAVASDAEIIKEIRHAIMETSRSLKRYISGIHREAMKVKRRNMFLKYAPEVADGLSKITGNPKEDIEASLIEVIKSKIKLKDGDEVLAKDKAEAA